MQRAKQGDLITVHYIGTLDNGKIFDQRDGDQPLSFTIGRGEVFPALEQGVIGMAAGEVRNISLDAEQATACVLKRTYSKFHGRCFQTTESCRSVRN